MQEIDKEYLDEIKLLRESRDELLDLLIQIEPTVINDKSDTYKRAKKYIKKVIKRAEDIKEKEPK